MRLELPSCYWILSSLSCCINVLKNALFNELSDLSASQAAARLEDTLVTFHWLGKSHRKLN